MTTEYKNPMCIATISNSYAVNNVAFFGGVFDLEHYNSVAIIKDCFCEANAGFNPIISAGGGSVLMEKGDQTTKILMFNNVFFNSSVSLRGNSYKFYKFYVLYRDFNNV